MLVSDANGLANNITSRTKTSGSITCQWPWNVTEAMVATSSSSSTALQSMHRGV